MLTVADQQQGLFDAAWCRELLPGDWSYALLAEHGDRIVRDVDGDAARLQVRVGHEQLRGDLEDYLVAADVRWLVRRYRRRRGLLRLAVLGEDHGSVGNREQVRSEAKVLLVRAAVPLKE